MPFTEPHIAQAALRGFQPFAADPAKQTRYHAYLHSQATPGSDAALLQPVPGQGPDEFRKEVESYAKAAQLFKPMSGAMANRFTSGGAVAVDRGKAVSEGLHRPSAAASAPSVGEVQEEKKRDDSPKAQAARLGMYGPLTRETKPWQPARLLCKRFGVKDPNPEPEVKTAAKTAATTERGSHADVAPGATTTPSPSKSSSVDRGHSANGKEEPRQIVDAVAAIRSAAVDAPPQIPAQPPPVDIYNTIFTGEEDVSEDEAEKEQDPKGSASTNIVNASVQPIEKVDLSTFKPTFVPRSEREKQSTSGKRDKKKKKGGKVLVSFEVEAGGVEAGSKSNDRPKKKRKHKGEDAGEVTMREKLPPEVVSEPPPPPPLPLSTDSASVDVAPPRGRKRAIDFM